MALRAFTSSRVCARISEIGPFVPPGAILFRLRPSIGEMNGSRLWNIAMLTTGTAMTAPRNWLGCSSLISRIAAEIDGYSVACTPAVRHRTIRNTRGPVKPLTTSCPALVPNERNRNT